MIQCWECKREISDVADKCPHCGAKSRSRTLADGCSGLGCILTLLVTVPIVILVALGTCH